MPDFLILGHRGARNKTHFQNSLSAFREALDAADGFETDTAISRDGVIYLMHDITYIHSVEYTLREMLTDESAAHVGTSRIDQMEAAEIDTLRLRNGEPIPRLHDAIELFRTHPGKILNVELKSDHTAEPVVAMLRAMIREGAIALGQVIVSSFNFPALAWVRKHAPEFKLGVLFSYETQKIAPLYPWTAAPEAIYRPFDRATFDTPLLRQIAPDFINLATQTLSLANIAAVRAAFPQTQFITWPGYEPDEATAPYLIDLLGELAERGWLYAWITDEPRLRKTALLK